MNINIFLSTVTDEFLPYRDQLRRDLTRHNVEVKVQEDFKDYGTVTLQKLDTYIKTCDAVIHLVGDMTGAVANRASVDFILSRYRDLGDRLPPLRGLSGLVDVPLSYTQWEAWLALYHGKTLLIAKADHDATRGPRYQTTDEMRASQEWHLQALRKVERFPGLSFRSPDDLAKQLLASAILDLLVEARTRRAEATHADAFSALPKPSLPAHFVERSVGDIARMQLIRHGTCVLLGPSGIGKSLLAARILEDLGDNSLWLDAATLDPTVIPHRTATAVLDGISEVQAVDLQGWLGGMQCNLIVTTTSHDAARTVLSCRGLADIREAIVQVSGLSTLEGKTFLDKTLGNALTDMEKVDLVARLQGSPIALQAVPDLILRRASDGPRSWLCKFLAFFGLRTPDNPSPHVAFLPDTGDFDAEGVASEIMKRWIASLRSREADRLLRILCKTSTLGMTADTLRAVAGPKVAGRAMSRHLAQAIDRGFIRKLRHHRFPDQEILSPHDVLRAYYSGIEVTQQDHDADARYLEYFLSHKAMDPASQVDAVMTGIRHAFSSGIEGQNDFVTDFNHFAGYLETLLTGNALPSHQIQRIADIFEQLLARLPPGMECSVVISIAQAIGFLPASTVLAKIIWTGADCLDAWARACSIRSAVRHWKLTGELETGVQHLREWLSSYITNSTTTDKSDFDLDLDLAAAVGGMCVLGDCDGAVGLFITAWEARALKHSHCSIGHHVLLAGLAANSRNSQLVGGVLKNCWNNLPDEPHKIFLGGYLASIGLTVPNPLDHPAGESGYALTVARAAHNQAFADYVRARDRACRAYV